MQQFPHLKFVNKIEGNPRLFGRGKSHPQTKINKQNFQSHGNYLLQKISDLKEEWSNYILNRQSQGLFPLSDDVVPVFLKLNPSLVNYAFDLKSFGIEIISEEDDGFIIGASSDGLRSLKEKINGFIVKEGIGEIGDFWEIIDGIKDNWKPQRILSEELWGKWNLIEDDVVYKIEVSIAFDKPLGQEPTTTTRRGQTLHKKYLLKQIERDEQLIERENHFNNFIKDYGRITSGIINFEDSFACEVEINGKGLKDLVFNYPFVFEVSELEKIGGVLSNSTDEVDSELEILPPEVGSPEVSVIDSGIMENHKYLADAINHSSSKSYLDTDTSTADYVTNGGHGTKVAGAILYPYGVSNITSPYKLPFWIRNLRVLDASNSLLNKLPAELMKEIVNDNTDCSIFNLSVNSKAPFRKKHMSSWAATIDSIIHEQNVVFIISAGNIAFETIREYIRLGESYPNYLLNPYCQIANPAQSSFALVVGSINHTEFEDDNWKSLGGKDDISPFSRIGMGIWGEIKPDVVEYGGGLVLSKNGINTVIVNKETGVELIRSTLNGGGAYGTDSVGTSFSTPKVTHIVAQLKKLYPDENVNLLRALVVQGARLPNNHFKNPTTESLRHFGYGLPSLERVTKNTEQRISFYTTSEIKAEEGYIYSLKIPEGLRNQGDEYDILIEVTLAYTAKVRRTRQKMKSYLSTWLDWESSKLDESLDDFKDFVLKEIDNEVTNYDSDARKGLGTFQWKIKNRIGSGYAKKINRNNSTVQKDWTIIKSNQLPEEICFCVKGHKGWDKNKEAIPYALVVSIEVLNANISIYEEIRMENEIEIEVR